MRKKILSLALALAMCLGLTIPAFAETWTADCGDGITVTTDSNGLVSYTRAGKLTADHAKYGIDIFGAGSYKVKTASIRVGQGLIMTDEFKELWNEQASYWELSISFNSSTAPARPEQPQQPVEVVASPTNDKLEVNGVAANPTVYKIDDSNYFKIRDVAALLNGTEKQFSVGYDGTKNAVTLTTGQGYDKQSSDLAGAAKGGDQTAIPSNDAIYVDGQKMNVKVYKINGSNYFKLRDLGKALDFRVGWSAERGMYIETY